MQVFIHLISNIFPPLGHLQLQPKTLRHRGDQPGATSHFNSHGQDPQARGGKCIAGEAMAAGAAGAGGGAGAGGSRPWIETDGWSGGKGATPWVTLSRGQHLKRKGSNNIS